MARRNTSTTITRQEYERIHATTEAPPAPSRGSRLAELLRVETDQSWRADAACKGKPTEWWFPEFNQRTTADLREAQRICASCPAQDPCRAYAERLNLVGVWGATHAASRIRDRRARTGNGRAPTSKLSPTALAILGSLDDGRWHDYNDVFDAIKATISIDRATARWNSRRKTQGFDPLPEARMTKAAIGSARRMVFVDHVNTLSRGGYIERGGGTLRRTAKEVAG